ncbi:MAG TPA: arginine--tRNA ligase [Patescibacteria group bacterium]|nr:arginine--tRNA ligase [Patescibacteria group bacterium]
MYAILKAKQEALRSLKIALDKSHAPAMGEIIYPPDPSFGDLAYPCFALAKGWKKAPAEVANELAAKIEPGGWIRKAEARGPYVNFFLSDVFFGKAVLDEIGAGGTAYGTGNGGFGKRVLVEYANMNTHKELHVGHARNLFVGQAAVMVLRSGGYDVTPVSYLNDLGMHVAKIIWGLEKFHAGEEPPKEERDAFLQKVYVEAERVFEEDPSAKEEISRVYKKLESGEKGPLLALWKKTRKWSLDSLKATFHELDLPIQAWYLESQFIRKTRELLEDLIRRGIVTHSQGAWIVDLASEGLGVYLLVRSDGTLLYYAKDLALAYKKEEDFHPEKSIYVVDNRQSLAMKQLFATLKRMGFKKDLVHLSYDFVTLKEGAMSSRKGTIIRYRDFQDSVVSSAREETEKRHPDWKPKKVEKTAKAIGLAAMQFGMLRQDPNKSIVFDIKEAVSFEGFTGPYLLYSVARIASLLKKAGQVSSSFDAKQWTQPLEHHLLLWLARYPEVVATTVQDFRFDRIAQFLFDLAKLFSAFYAEVPVLQAEEKVRQARLALVGAVGQTLRNGLSLLGIKTVEEM